MNMVRTLTDFGVVITIITTAAVAAAQPARAGRTKNGIAYDVQGAGPVVVLVTGSNLDRRMWAREAVWLASTHTVARYDLRAHGESETATMPFSHVDDLLTLLDEIGVQRATLIGLSAGSTIALDAALLSPTRFDRLVLVGPSISGNVSRTPPPFAADLIAALQQRNYKKASEVLLGSSVFAVPSESQALVGQMVIENDRLWSVPRELMRQTERPALNRLDEINIPTLVLVGENDLLQREEAEFLARRVRDGRLVIIPGGGHLLNLTSPEEFRAQVSQFLR
jgi:pimeloyl-ACP methyl ester carboxylesterase